MCPKNRVQYSMRYSWGIRGIFVEYSWDIRMYRVCVGYVSGMYREYVEGDGEGGICVNLFQDETTGREEYGEGGVNTFILRIKNINFSDKCSQMTLTANSLARNLHTTLWQRKMASNLPRDCCHQT